MEANQVAYATLLIFAVLAAGLGVVALLTLLGITVRGALRASRRSQAHDYDKRNIGSDG